MRRLARWFNRERGQTLVIAAGMAIVFLGLIGLGIDVGRLWVAKARLSRTVDAAALAGALELPDLTVDEDGDGDTAESRVIQYVAANEPDAYLTEAPVSPWSRQVQVNASLDVDTIFMRVLPGAPDTVTVSAEAVAGFGEPLEVALAMDETGSMQGDPLADSKAAATDFADVLLPDSGVSSARIALIPYRAWYESSSPSCSWSLTSPSWVRPTNIVNFTESKATITSGINGMCANGYTNVCEGLNRSYQVMNTGHDPTAERILVILTDGDNNPDHDIEDDPAGPCDPVGDPCPGPSWWCSWFWTDPTIDERDKDLDTKTYDLVENTLKPAGIEVYVVGLSVAGTDDGNLCNPALIGGTLGDNDNPSDRNLLKCIASSKAGTNDHYFEAESSDELSALFTTIAREVGFRLIR